MASEDLDGDVSRATLASAPAAAPSIATVQEVVIVPVTSLVLFPGVVLPLALARPGPRRAVEHALSQEKPIGVLLQKNDEVEEPGPADLHEVGTLTSILRYIAAEDGTRLALCQGERRFRVIEFVATEPMLVAKVQLFLEPEIPPGDAADQIRARFTALKEQASEAVRLMPGAPDDLARLIESARSPGMLADLIATFLDVPTSEKQELLERFDLRERLELVAEKLAHLVSVLRLTSEIRQRTKGSLDKAQREYFLREQLKTIHKELGEEEEDSHEMRELSAAIDAAGLPPEVLLETRKELKRLARMPPAAGEYSMIRTWIDIVLDLPWTRSTIDALDLKEARRILDEDHFGLERVKKRILEYLAVKKLKPDGKSPILCLVGPPGVGKTSLGQSIARAMGRKFVRISLGGVHDEAEIRGHRRTYIGAMPGNILQGIRKAGSNNPVFMLDEMDKLGVGLHGDPSSALLEVLDPEQNSSFRDAYLNLSFDLRKVMFIGTANVLDQIPRALRDRCEVIQLSGYIAEEKLAIARDYLIPRQLDQNGLQPGQCTIAEAALRKVIADYTRESGVRNLERQIGAIMRHAAARVAAQEAERVEIDVADLRAILGPPKYESEVAMRTSVTGVATGLAWTPVGGDILFIEATRMRGRGQLVLTGQLGEVMRESAQAALSLVKNHALALGIDPDAFEGTDIHIHLPSGAIPKDGPSAGVTMYVALASLFMKRTVKSDVAMTGEISLRGLVLPVGGIREKVLAALAAGIRTVLLPARNKDDLEEIPERIRGQLTFVWIETVRDAVAAALDPVATPAAKRRSKSTRRRSTKPERAEKRKRGPDKDGRRDSRAASAR